MKLFSISSGIIHLKLSLTSSPQDGGVVTSGLAAQKQATTTATLLRDK